MTNAMKVLIAHEGLVQTWMDLTDVQREFTGLQEIMDNINTSVDLLKKYGKDAIPLLNQDGGLEALLQVPEKLITVEKSLEDLSSASKEFAQKSVQTLLNFIERIKIWFQQFFEWIGGIFVGNAQLVKVVQNLKFDLKDDKQLVALSYAKAKKLLSHLRTIEREVKGLKLSDLIRTQLENRTRLIDQIRQEVINENLLSVDTGTVGSLGWSNGSAFSIRSEFIYFATSKTVQDAFNEMRKDANDIDNTSAKLKGLFDDGVADRARTTFDLAKAKLNAYVSQQRCIAYYNKLVRNVGITLIRLSKV